MIVVLAEMPQNQGGGTRIKFMPDIIGYYIVRKMTVTAHDTLLYGPGVWADLQHFQIVVGFEHQNVRAAQMKFDGVRNIAEIGNDCDLDALRAETKSDRIDRVVRNRKA